MDGARRLQRRFRWLLLWVAVQSLIFGKATYPIAVFGYSLLFLVGAIVGYIGVYLLRITPDKPMAPAEKAGPTLALLFAPLREENFKRLILFLASWNFAANLAAPFFTVYMLKSLDYPMTTILALTIASQLSNIAALGLWGALIDRFSNKSVLKE